MTDFNWDTLYRQVQDCTRCGLCKGILHKVPGQGDHASPLLIIGEGPGQMQDEQGLAFVGPAGQLLTRMLAAIHLPRNRVYIANVVKCRPPANRVPLPDEQASCLVFLRMQFSLMRPKVMLLLGSTAAKAILGDSIRITRDRGKWFFIKGVWFLPTYHPSALLRDPAKKREAWQDMQLLRDKLIELGLYSDIYPAGEEQS